MRKIDQTGSAKGCLAVAPGRPRTARSTANIEIVDNRICSQEDKPGTSKSPREIARETGISRSSVRRIEKKILKNMMTRVKISLVLLANTLLKDGKSARNNHVLGL